ncbi:lysostaphin resistance A-like protein [Calditrichota bacterium]
MRENKLKKLFRNRFGHFRAGWRIVICLGLIIAAFVPIAGLLKIWDLLTPDRSRPGNPDDFASLVNVVFFIGLNISVIVGSWLSLRWIDKRPYSLLGLDFNLSAVKDFSKGFLLGFLNILVIFIVLNFSGLVEVRISVLDSTLFAGVAWYFTVFAVAAIFEEVINRGYFFQALIEGTRTWIAVIIIALIFILGHISNPGFGWNNAIFFFVHGVLYCMLYLITRSIWVPAGFHLAWNWTQGSIFGMNVSGIVVEDTLFICETRGSTLLSGGDFGAEGSLISIVISIFFILFLIKSKWLKPAEFRSALWRKYPAGFGLEAEEQDV